MNGPLPPGRSQLTLDRNQLTPLVPTLIATLSSESDAAANQAAEALREIGHQAEPALAASLDGNTNTRSVALALDCLGFMGARDSVDVVAERLGDPSVAVRASAAGAIASIGPSAKTTAPKLIALLNEDSSPAVRSRAATALGNFDGASPAAIEALTKAAADANASVARASLESLLYLKADPEVVNPIISKQLADNRREVVAEAMLALTEQGEDALPVIRAALEDKSTQYWAALVASELDAEVAGQLLPDLTTALPDAVPETQREILLALANFGPAAKPASEQVAALLKTKDAGVQYAATYAIGQIGESSNAANQSLTANFNGSDPLLKMTSAWAIAKLDSDNQAKVLGAARELIGGLTSDDASLQQAAAQCLADLKPDSTQLPQLVPQLFAAFKSEDPSVKTSVLDMFAATIPPEEGNRLLGLALKNPVTRPFGVQAAQRVGAKAVGVTGDLAATLSDERAEIREQAAVALATIGEPAAAATPELVKLLDDDDQNVRRAAAQALGSFGGAAKPSSAKLMAIASNPADPAAGVAAAALTKIAPDDANSIAAALPRLAEVLRSGRPGEREAAVRSLAQLGDAPGMDEVLEYAAQDPLRSVRRVAREALE